MLIMRVGPSVATPGLYGDWSLSVLGECGPTHFCPAANQKPSMFNLPAISTEGGWFKCCCLKLSRWSGSHIKWGQSFRVRHITTGRYLCLDEEKGLLVVDSEKANSKMAAFCFRATKVRQLSHVKHHQVPDQGHCEEQDGHNLAEKERETEREKEREKERE